MCRNVIDSFSSHSCYLANSLSPAFSSVGPMQHSELAKTVAETVTTETASAPRLSS